MKEIRDRWTLLLQMSALVLGSVFLFVLSPPRLTPAADAQAWFTLGEFIGAILIVLLLFVVRRSALGAKALWLATGGTLLAAVMSSFAYRWLVGIWTCGDYDSRGPIVIGSELLPESARDYEKPVSACRMVQEAIGDTSTLWPHSELLARHDMMAALFLLTALLFFVAAILAIELGRSLIEMKEEPGP